VLDGRPVLFREQLVLVHDLDAAGDVVTPGEPATSNPRVSVPFALVVVTERNKSLSVDSCGKGEKLNSVIFSFG